MKKLLVILAISIFVISSFLMACAKPAPAPSPAPAPAPSPAPAPAPSPAPAPAPSPTPAPAPSPAPAPAPSPTPSQPAEVFNWKGQIAPAAGSIWYKSWVRMTERIAAASNGRIVMELLPGGSISPAAKEILAVNDGIMEFSIIGASHYMSLVPTASLLTSPVGGMSQVGYMVWYSYGGGSEFVKKAFAEVAPNVILFSETPAVIGAEVWGHSTKELRSLADFKGLKMRVLGDAGEIFNRMGASTIAMPPGEIYEALKRGVVDAAENSGPAENLAYGYHEIAEYMYFSATRGPIDTTFPVISKDQWAKLPSDLQELLLDEFQTNREYQFSHTLYLDLLAMQQFKELGVKMFHLPADIERETLRVAKEFYAEKAAADPFFAEIVASQDAWRKQYEEYVALVEPQVE